MLGTLAVSLGSELLLLDLISARQQCVKSRLTGKVQTDFNSTFRKLLLEVDEKIDYKRLMNIF